MALQQDFVDACGVAHPSAHWRAVNINIDAAGGSIGLVFNAFASLAAFGSGKAPLAGGVKSYSVSGAEFAGLAAAAPAGATLYDVLAHASEGYALGKLDTPGPGGTLVSFFAGASQV
jgi:hypothetical protein